MGRGWLMAGTYGEKYAKRAGSMISSGYGRFEADRGWRPPWRRWRSPKIRQAFSPAVRQRSAIQTANLGGVFRGVFWASCPAGCYHTNGLPRCEVASLAPGSAPIPFASVPDTRMDRYYRFQANYGKYEHWMLELTHD